MVLSVGPAVRPGESPGQAVGWQPAVGCGFARSAGSGLAGGQKQPDARRLTGPTAATTKPLALHSPAPVDWLTLIGQDAAPSGHPQHRRQTSGRLLHGVALTRTDVPICPIRPGFGCWCQRAVTEPAATHGYRSPGPNRPRFDWSGFQGDGTGGPPQWPDAACHWSPNARRLLSAGAAGRPRRAGNREQAPGEQAYRRAAEQDGGPAASGDSSRHADASGHAASAWPGCDE